MLTLGIHDGHTATACLMENGRVAACVSEERLNRDKEWAGFPKLAIQECLALAGKDIGEIDSVGVASLMPQIGHAGWNAPGWHKRMFGRVVPLLPSRVLQSPKNIDRVHRIASVMFRGRRNRILQELESMGVARSKVRFHDHHFLHAATAYYQSWFRDRKTLVVTLDGAGDAVCATLNVGEHGKIKRLSQVFSYNSICDLYTFVTYHLGMKPMSHEYKVMGMAPYASDHGFSDVCDRFRSYFQIDPDNPLQFVNTSRAWKWQLLKRFERDLGRARFDVVSGAVQRVFEEIVVEWIRNAIRSTGIGHLALSGGGFMNVKLNYLISKLPEVESLFVFPSCGDESNPIGAACAEAVELGFPASDIHPLEMVYWGREYSDDDIRSAIDKELPGQGLEVARLDDVNQGVAESIAEGKVVGRFTGRMEWGARALGNRSILADPRKPQIIHKINKAIKMRDFWMPFAPSILREYRERYLELRPDYECPFMTIAPDTRREAWDAIPAGLHPFDRSARAQVLDPENHPSFYDVVSRFERITGIGGVLNTSFNLHGDPIVMSPEDAIYTFLNSGLEVLQLNDWLIKKPGEGDHIQAGTTEKLSVG